jgi:hypothetical protein
MARENYIAVTGDDWYQRRRQDEEGEFFRKVADQGPRKGEGGSTRQGTYLLTAGGKLLGYKNAGQAPDVMRDVLRQGLTAWRKLSEEERKPGRTLATENSKVDRQFTRQPPAGAGIVNVYTRVLERKNSTEFQCCSGLGMAAARDHLWVLLKEIDALANPRATQGQTVEMPASLAERILRFHLVDDTRGEPPHWSPVEIRKREFTLVAVESTPKLCKLKLEGRALLATDADPMKAARGFDVHLQGFITIDTDQRRLTRFDLVALGEHWGEGTFTRGARAGRSPLGVVFELLTGDSPADQVPPQGAREIAAYLGK